MPANKKAKEVFIFMDAQEAAEINSAEDVQDIECDLYYFDTDTWEDLLDKVHLIWLFNE